MERCSHLKNRLSSPMKFSAETRLIGFFVPFLLGRRRQ